MTCLCGDVANCDSEVGSFGGKNNFRLMYCGSEYCKAVRRYMWQQTDKRTGIIPMWAVRRLQRVALKLEARYIRLRDERIRTAIAG